MANKERVALLVAALRSGEFPQGKGVLHDPVTGTYCCLGVATVVAVRNGLVPVTGDYLHHGDEILHSAVAEWYGFNEPDADGEDPALLLVKDEYPYREPATEVNDSGEYSFNDIADAFESTYIEENHG